MRYLETLEGFRPANNFVLVGSAMDVNKVGSLYMDTTFSPEHHVEVLNEVIAVPDRLKKLAHDHDGHMGWETDMQLQKGDKVWVNYLSIMKGEKISVGDKVYSLVPYYKIYFAKRGEDVIMLNGYVLLEPIVIPALKSTFIDLMGKDTEDKRNAIVRYIGQPNKSYFDVTKDVQQTDDSEIEVGDKVVLRKGSYSKIENEMHSNFGNYWVTQRRNIVAKWL